MYSNNPNQLAPSGHYQTSPQDMPPHGHNQHYKQHQQQDIPDNNDNPLLTATMPLLTLISQIRHTINHPDVTSLRSQVLEEIEKAVRMIHQMGYPSQACLVTQYCLCTAIDEAVLSHSWGSNSPWVQNSLLSIKHKETWGGEEFYIILEHHLKDLRSNIDFIEFMYFLLSLGYEGKLHGKENLPAREEIRNRIFYRIRQTRQKPDKTLSKFWKVKEQIKSNSHRKRKIKRLLLSVVIVLIIAGGIYNLRVSDAASNVTAKLANIGIVSPVTVFSQVISRPVIQRNHLN